MDVDNVEKNPFVRIDAQEKSSWNCCCWGGHSVAPAPEDSEDSYERFKEPKLTHCPGDNRNEGSEKSYTVGGSEKVSPSMKAFFVKYLGPNWESE